MNHISLEGIGVLHAFTNLSRTLNNAAQEGYLRSTCSFLRAAIGRDFPAPDYIAYTTQPCHATTNIMHDLADKYFAGSASGQELVIDTPTVRTPANIEYVATQLRELASRLAGPAGLAAFEANLGAALLNTGRAMRLMAEINLLRARSGKIMSAGEMVKFGSGISEFMGTAQLVSILEELRAEIEKRHAEPASAGETLRLVWLYLPPYFKTNLFSIIDAYGGNIVGEEVNMIDSELLADLTNPAAIDPYQALAKRFISPAFAIESRKQLWLREVIELHRQQGLGLDGVILYAHGFGHCPLANESVVKHLRGVMESHNIPSLILEGDCLDSTVDPCSSNTKVRAFLEKLNQEKYGNVFGCQPY
jgi:benzoyl-CoA reductase/2-hydroxyglutaryl-CoA dehydratase subunit BcrC/BadD/HgdB